MTRIFLVDDEPLVLIGMQGMLNWSELGYEVAGTARNGAEALKAIEEKRPDIVVSDIRMPVMDGFTLAESCHKDGSALPVFIMLTSYEEFDYVKRSMRLGVVDYLVKIDLTAEGLAAALDKARTVVEKERRLQEPSAPAVSMDSYRDRLFLQLYSGSLTDRARFDRQCAELDLHFDAPQYVVALGSLQVPEQATDQLLTLSTGVTRMAAETLPKYHPCRVTGMDLRHFSVLLPLQEGEDPEATLAPALQATRADFVQLFQFAHLLGRGAAGEGHFAGSPKPEGCFCHPAIAAQRCTGGVLPRAAQHTAGPPRPGSGPGAAVHPRTSGRAPDAERGGRSVQLQPQLPKPAVCTKQRERLCGICHRHPHCRRQGDDGLHRHEDLRDQ